MKYTRSVTAALLVLAAILPACGRTGGDASPPAPEVRNHSFARPFEVLVTHFDLDLTVDFPGERLRGSVTVQIDNRLGAPKLYLDTAALRIHRVTIGADDLEASFVHGDSVPHVGRPLIIDIPTGATEVTVHYETLPGAAGVQWLSPEQTLDGEHPFLFTQSQAILARSWVPCQDTPEVRVTYRARIKTSPELMALMSATNPTQKSESGEYTFEMKQPIPSYLLALAVGDLTFRRIGARTGVYASPDLIDEARWEFADTEKMMEVAEGLYGPYRWERFDILVLPPSFPYGGMENPRLTFVTPILVAGDRSLVSTIAHELAHSWSGNLVTNATWGDFWLNEGFTTYFERRIMEAVYGKEEMNMQAYLGYRDLQKTFERLGDDHERTRLKLSLDDRDPDADLGIAQYEKGYLMLRLIEQTVGRERWDGFLREYFETFAFQTMTTSRFLAYLRQELLPPGSGAAEAIGLDEWVYEPGLPDNAPTPVTLRFAVIDEKIQSWLGGTPPGELGAEQWRNAEWQHFIDHLPPLSASQMKQLDDAFDFSERNGEIQRSWYLVVIANDYTPEFDQIERFLLRVGRLWLIGPIYDKLAETEAGRRFAERVYSEARPGYHAATARAIDRVLGHEGSGD